MNRIAAEDGDDSDGGCGDGAVEALVDTAASDGVAESIGDAAMTKVLVSRRW